MYQDYPKYNRRNNAKVIRDVLPIDNCVECNSEKLHFSARKKIVTCESCGLSLPLDDYLLQVDGLFTVEGLNLSKL